MFTAPLKYKHVFTVSALSWHKMFLLFIYKIKL